MFVDESGDPGYPKDGNWTKFGGTRSFVRLGLIIHGWKWKAWNQRLINFKKMRGLLWDSEIKASDLRKGAAAFSGWDWHRRALFMKDLSTLIGRNHDFTLIGISIDKTKVDIHQKERFSKPSICSLELLLERYNQFLQRQQDKMGIVVLDPSMEQDDDNLRYFQSFLQASSPHLNPLHIVEGTFFAKSHTSNMIQLADFCSNVFYQEISRKDNSPEWREIHPRFDRLNGRIIGIKHWPTALKRK